MMQRFASYHSAKQIGLTESACLENIVVENIALARQVNTGARLNKSRSERPGVRARLKMNDTNRSLFATIESLARQETRGAL